MLLRSNEIHVQFQTCFIANFSCGMASHEMYTTILDLIKSGDTHTLSKTRRTYILTQDVISKQNTNSRHEKIQAGSFYDIF